MTHVDYVAEIPPFRPADWVVFALVLSVSASIGLYYGWVTRKRQSTVDVILAGRSMSALPVALSVLASFFSSSTLLGTPAEIYLRGTMYWMCVFGAMLAPCAGAYLFGPLFHRIGCISVFEVLYTLSLIPIYPKVSYLSR